MRTNEAGIEIIKRHEGLRLRAYLCPAGVLSIGYGSTGPDVYEGLEITEEEAELRLLKDVARAERGVARGLSAPVGENQLSALVSFAFNVGTEAFWRSTLRAYVNRKAWGEAAGQFGRWNKARVGGKLTALPGLTARRREEAALFLRPDRAGA